MSNALLSDNKKMSLAVVVCAAASILGAFLPWASVSFGGISSSASGFDGGDGKIIVLLAAAAGVIAFMWMQGKLAKSGLLLGAMIAMAICALISVKDFFDIGDAPGAGAVSVSRGIGIYLCLLGTLAGTAAAFFAWRSSGKVVSSDA